MPATKTARKPRATGTAGTPKKRARNTPATTSIEVTTEQLEETIAALARPEWADRFLNAVRERGAILPACRASRVSKSTYYRHVEQFPAFAAEVAAVKADCVELVEGSLFEEAMTPNGTTAKIFYLKTHKPEQYADRLNPNQVAAIQAEARKVALKEMQDEIARLPEEARKIVMESMAAVTAKELSS